MRLAISLRMLLGLTLFCACKMDVTERGQLSAISATRRDNNLALGNPSNAAKAPDNYLLSREQYTLSYNSSKGIPNWVSWHLSAAWNGYQERCNCFYPDEGIPAGSFRAGKDNYYHSGYDRGHLCPADDRDAGIADNAATFAMANIAPQVPELNRHTWEKLEAYCRKLVSEGNELYIIAGSYGEKGRINGRISVPARFWKVILVLPEGENDLDRVTGTSRLIAVDMPNEAGVDRYGWSHYRTSLSEIEKATGYDLLSVLPADLQQTLASRTDTGPIH